MALFEARYDAGKIPAPKLNYPTAADLYKNPRFRIVIEDAFAPEGMYDTFLKSEVSICHFTKVLPLIRHREVILFQGNALVPSSIMNKFEAISNFEQEVKRFIAGCKRSLETLKDDGYDERPWLDGLIKYQVGKYRDQIAQCSQREVPLEFTPQYLGDIEDMVLPPCMTNLRAALIQNRGSFGTHSHDGRYAYTSYMQMRKVPYETLLIHLRKSTDKWSKQYDPVEIYQKERVCFGCEKMRQKALCPGKCAEINHPISWKNP